MHIYIFFSARSLENIFNFSRLINYIQFCEFFSGEELWCYCSKTRVLCSAARIHQYRLFGQRSEENINAGKRFLEMTDHLFTFPYWYKIRGTNERLWGARARPRARANKTLSANCAKWLVFMQEFFLDFQLLNTRKKRLEKHYVCQTVSRECYPHNTCITFKCEKKKKKKCFSLLLK